VNVANLINASLLVATVVAAIAALSQARSARVAKRDAVKAKVEAQELLTAANASAAALQRQANAMERQLALAESAATVTEKWEVVDLGGGHLHWNVTNRTGQVVVAWLDMEQINPSFATPDQDFGSTVRPGESLGFQWSKRLTSQSTITFAVYWKDALNEDHSEVKTVTWPGE
jgi:multidrug efflux pump subunit AcrA (membrane-fusion protein)